VSDYDAGPYLPSAPPDLAALRDAARDCHGCPLWEGTTQTVFGDGAPDARIVLVGEQPGDQEDRHGEPFVGPAGRVLDRALAEAGIDRSAVYLTNAVKHFKYTRREGGKRRIHQTPDAKEITACRPWLAAELAVLRPDVIVALGATAGKSLFGPGFRVTKQRGRPIPLEELPDRTGLADLDLSGVQAVATVHPSAVLRAPDRDAAYAEFLADLKTIPR